MDVEQRKKVKHCFRKREYLNEREFIYIRGLYEADKDYELTFRQINYLEIIYNKVKEREAK